MAEQLAVQDGARVFDLEQPRTMEMPIHPAHLPGYFYSLHTRHQDGFHPEVTGSNRASASGVITMMEHSGTHIDALSHQSDCMMLFGGVNAADVQTPRGFTSHGVEEIGPIVAPGILLDMAAYFGVDELEAERPISAADMQACCAQLGVRVEAGNVVLVRTGNAHYWHDTERYLRSPGMDASASRWLAECKVLAVGADNMAWDVIGLRDPELGMMPGHLILLAQSGIYIIENLALDELAATGVSRFSFVCTPLKFVGATGSPVRPIAIVPAE